MNELISALKEIFEQGHTIPEELANRISNILIRKSKISDKLWRLAGGNFDAYKNYVGSYGSPLSDELNRNPVALDSERTRLSNPYPEGFLTDQISPEGIRHAPLQSSNIYGFSYDPRQKKLLVQFNSGSVYSYDNVPQNIFNIFKNGAIPARTKGKNRWGEWWVGKIPSLGAAFFNAIRSGPYQYQKVA